MNRITRVSPSHSTIRLNAVVACLLVCAVVAMWFAVRFRTHENILNVWFFDVGQGDAIFLEYQGYQMLIDGGPNATILSKLGNVMWPWDKTIDAVILTHPDADHATGLISVLERYRVSTMYESGRRKDTNIDRTFDALAFQETPNRYAVLAPQTIRVGKELVLELLSPSVLTSKEVNGSSLVFKLTFGETTILLTGDAIAEQEGVYGQYAGDVDVLKIGHHGSLTSTSVALLETVTPEIAIVSVGANNPHGHPHPVVLRRLYEYGVSVLRTDVDGDIVLRSNGGEPSVSPTLLIF